MGDGGSRCAFSVPAAGSHTGNPGSDAIRAIILRLFTYSLCFGGLSHLPCLHRVKVKHLSMVTSGKAECPSHLPSYLPSHLPSYLCPSGVASSASRHWDRAEVLNAHIPKG